MTRPSTRSRLAPRRRPSKVAGHPGNGSRVATTPEPRPSRRWLPSWSRLVPSRLVPSVGRRDRQQPARARPGPRATRRLTLLLAVAVLLAATAVGYLGHQLHRADAVSQARSEGLAAATRYVPRILSYDHRHLDKDFAAARANLTGGFGREYAETTERVVRSQAEQAQAVVRAEAVASSIVSAEPDSVRALLFVNQTTTSNEVQSTKVDLTRVVVTLQRHDGRWLVSGMSAL